MFRPETASCLARGYTQTRRSWLTVLLLALVLPVASIADPISFDDSWSEQGFLRLWTNDYRLRGERVDIISNGTVSLLWRPLEQEHQNTEEASWTWQVDQGVGATDLTVKGGDDRNIALYFVFVDKSEASNISPKSARRLLRNPNVSAIVYVWGGNHEIGQVLQSPYHPRLKTKVLRKTGLGANRERVNLQADYQLAFGNDGALLVGIGVSSDSDDTNGKIRAILSQLSLH